VLGDPLKLRRIFARQPAARLMLARWINAGERGDPHGGTPKVLARDLDDPGLAASHSAQFGFVVNPIPARG
jgi:hypothetical protein